MRETRTARPLIFVGQPTLSFSLFHSSNTQVRPTTRDKVWLVLNDRGLSAHILVASGELSFAASIPTVGITTILALLGENVGRHQFSNRWWQLVGWTCTAWYIASYRNMALSRYPGGLAPRGVRRLSRARGRTGFWAQHFDL